MRSLGLVRLFSEQSGQVHQLGARVLGIEALELAHQFPGSLVNESRDDDLHLDVLIPADIAAEARRPLFSESKDLPRLCARWDAQRGFPP